MNGRAVAVKTPANTVKWHDLRNKLIPSCLSWVAAAVGAAAAVAVAVAVVVVAAAAQYFCSISVNKNQDML